MKPPRTYRGIIYPKTKQVACVLLQALYGGDSQVAHFFPSRLWAVAPPPNDKPTPVQGTAAEWTELVARWTKEK